MLPVVISQGTSEGAFSRERASEMSAYPPGPRTGVAGAFSVTGLGAFDGVGEGVGFVVSFDGATGDRATLLCPR